MSWSLISSFPHNTFPSLISCWYFPQGVGVKFIDPSTLMRQMDFTKNKVVDWWAILSLNLPSSRMSFCLWTGHVVWTSWYKWNSSPEFTVDSSHVLLEESSQIVELNRSAITLLCEVYITHDRDWSLVWVIRERDINLLVNKIQICMLSSLSLSFQGTLHKRIFCNFDGCYNKRDYVESSDAIPSNGQVVPDQRLPNPYRSILNSGLSRLFANHRRQIVRDLFQHPVFIPARSQE